LELNAITLLSAKIDDMTQMLEHLNVNSVSSNAPSISCEVYGSIDRLTVNCQFGCSFVENASDQANYVNNYNPRLTNDPSSNAYNSGWRNDPNFSYKPNIPPMPQLNAIAPPGFQRLPYPQQAPQKSNLEAMMGLSFWHNRSKMSISSNYLLRLMCLVLIIRFWKPKLANKLSLHLHPQVDSQVSVSLILKSNVIVSS